MQRRWSSPAGAAMSRWRSASLPAAPTFRFWNIRNSPDAIYFTVRAGRTIPEELFVAVATILAFVFQLERAVAEDAASPMSKFGVTSNSIPTGAGRADFALNVARARPLKESEGYLPWLSLPLPVRSAPGRGSTFPSLSMICGCSRHDPGVQLLDAGAAGSGADQRRFPGADRACRALPIRWRRSVSAGTLRSTPTVSDEADFGNDARQYQCRQLLGNGGRRPACAEQAAVQRWSPTEENSSDRTSTMTLRRRRHRPCDCNRQHEQQPRRAGEGHQRQRRRIGLDRVRHWRQPDRAQGRDQGRRTASR